MSNLINEFKALLMVNSIETYTYRCGKKVNLLKSPEKIIVRAAHNLLSNLDYLEEEEVSPHATRLRVASEQLEEVMARARHIAPTHHAYSVAETNEDFLITDRVFITFNSEISEIELDDFSGKYGLLNIDKYSKNEYLFLVTDHTGLNPIKLVNKLMESEDKVIIADHDLNFIFKKYDINIPSDEHYNDQWHLHQRSSHSSFDPRSSSRSEDAWRLMDSFGNSDVVVCVTDDGCKMDHPDFNSPEKFADWGYFHSDDDSRLVTRDDFDADPSKMFDDNYTSTHGTSCAGVIAAEIDGVLTVGAAPGVRLLPIKFKSGPGGSLYIGESRFITVLRTIGDKIDIMSNSWGPAGPSKSSWNQTVRNMISNFATTGGRRGKGIIFCWAAGNENCPINTSTSIPVPYDSGWQASPSAPSGRKWVGVKTSTNFENDLVDIPNVMFVGALSSSAQRSHYSRYGEGLSICAPSSNRHMYHRLTLRGIGITTTTGRRVSSDAIVRPDFGGTSSATPLVAGIASLVISANPNLSALEVISILKRTASKDLNFSPYPRTPSLKDIDENPSWDVSPIAPFNQGNFLEKGLSDGTWSPWFGHGRVDALNAVSEALRLRSE